LVNCQGDRIVNKSLFPLLSHWGWGIFDAKLFGALQAMKYATTIHPAPNRIFLHSTIRLPSIRYHGHLSPLLPAWFANVLKEQDYSTPSQPASTLAGCLAMPASWVMKLLTPQPNTATLPPDHSLP
jgi:hypothetical protein